MLIFLPPGPSAKKVALVNFLLGLYDAGGSCLCTQILDYWKNQNSSSILLIQYVLILMWLYGHINVLGLYKLHCYLYVSFTDCSIPVQIF